jgi:hypothetical protein
MLVLVVALTFAQVSPPSGAFSPPASFGRECWVQPLQLSVSELAMTGQIADEYVSNHCARFMKGNFPRFPGRATSIAQTRIARFELFGERLSFGFDVVVVPGALGHNDTIYTAPVLDLPESWDRVIDTATYPALAIAGTAIITTIIVQALKN